MGFDSREFRRVLGQFATGVTVVTVKTRGGYHGMTANAVASVSLEPPLVLVCVDHRTRLDGHFRDGVGHFALSILSEAQRPLSDHFADIRRLGQDPFETEPLLFGPSGSPVFRSAIGWVDCRIEGRHPGGDHTICVGRVLDLGLLEAGASPLVFFRGEYGRFAGTGKAAP